jgi:glycosyltransferase 2 family protein
MTSQNSGSRARVARAAFGIVGMAFTALAFRNTWSHSRSTAFPSACRLVIAGLLTVSSRVSSALAWSQLFGSAWKGPRIRAYLTAQPAKYIPGGLWQALSQIDLTRRAGVELQRAALAFPAWMAIQAAAAGCVGATFALNSAANTWLRLASLAGLVAVLSVHRGWLVRVTRTYLHWRGRRFRDDLVPSQRDLVYSGLWCVITTLAAGAAFATVLGASTTMAPATLVTVFALAWLVGFLAIPFPAGIGVREGTMIALAGPIGGATIAASVICRLLNIVSEGALAAFSLAAAVLGAEHRHRIYGRKGGKSP